MDTKRMTNIAMMACVITICSWITVPYTVPFTMQTFAVFCALLLLGGRDGTLAIALYVLLGCVGVPVFSGFQGGIGHVLGPTGGYIIGFIFTALCYFAFEQLTEKHKKLRLPVLTLGLFLCYVIGTIWFRTVFGMRGTEYSVWAVISICVLPYIIPDMLKLLLALQICKRVKKAIDFKQ